MDYIISSGFFPGNKRFTSLKISSKLAVKYTDSSSINFTQFVFGNLDLIILKYQKFNISSIIVSNYLLKSNFWNELHYAVDLNYYVHINLYNKPYKG